MKVKVDFKKPSSGSILDIFDKTVKPILLYGCETWGFGKNDINERVHLKFCKLLLHVKTSTPNFMVYGELGIQLTTSISGLA
jgi:hypothetical protein